MDHKYKIHCLQCKKENAEAYSGRNRICDSCTTSNSTKGIRFCFKCNTPKELIHFNGDSPKCTNCNTKYLPKCPQCGKSDTEHLPYEIVCLTCSKSNRKYKTDFCNTCKTPVSINDMKEGRHICKQCHSKETCKAAKENDYVADIIRKIYRRLFYKPIGFVSIRNMAEEIEKQLEKDYQKIQESVVKEIL